MSHGGGEVVSLLDMKRYIQLLEQKLAVNEKILETFTNDLIDNIALTRSLITVLEANAVVDTTMLDHFVEEQRDKLIQGLVEPAL